MYRSVTTRRLFWAWTAAIILACRAQADIIIQSDGKIVVGRATHEDQPEIRVATGSAQGPREIGIPRAKVGRLLRGNEEITKVVACTDPQLLSQWTAAYYFAHLELSATRCLERALDLDPSLGEKPLAASKPAGGPAAKYVAFWNRAVLRRLAASNQKADAPRLLGLARWTRSAGMNDRAFNYLRRAWAVDPGDAEVKRLAAEWAVPLESWVQVDLTLALDTPLVTTEITDDGVRVMADPGKVFVTLPIRYESPVAAAPAKDRAATTLTIARTTLRGKDARAFYGLRMVRPADGTMKFDGSDHGPIYERLELTSGEGVGLVVLRNRLGPRRAEDHKPKAGKPRQTKLRDEPLTVRSSGFSALVLEVPKTTDRLSFEWPDGGGESVDLDFLRKNGETEIDHLRLRDPKGTKDMQPWAALPAIARSLAFVRDSSPAMTALAIARLSKIRGRLVAALDADQFDDDLFSAWIADVDSAVVSSVGREEERVRVAAWNYFCEPAGNPKSTSLPDETLNLFADADPVLQLRWVRLMACGLRCEDCGLWWKVPSVPVSSPMGSNPSSLRRSHALAILGALLRSEDASVTAEAMDVLTSLMPPVTDWDFMNEASIAAQRAAVERVVKITDRTAAFHLIQALIVNAGEETAADIADAAMALGSAVDDPSHALLSQWPSLNPSIRRTAFLAALCGIDLGESVYSRPFVDLIQDATKSPDPTRDAAWRLLIAQLRLRRENTEAAGLRGDEPTSTNPSTPSPGPFPLIIVRSANDPLTKGVIAIVHQAGPAVRVDALKALVESGYAEQAAVCLTESCRTDDEREAALSELIPLAQTGHRDAVLALLGALLKKDFESIAGRILDHLSRLVAQVDQRDHWRVFAAVKSGVHLGDLDELGILLRPPASVAVVRWLHALGHLSPQDQQRLTSSRDPVERARRLEQIDFRRGQLVDGRYGVLAVVSTTQRREPLPFAKDAPVGRPRDTTPRWSQPKRVTLALAPLTLATLTDQDIYKVRWGDREIGEGLILQRPQPIRGPAAFIPALNTFGPWGPPPAPSLIKIKPPADDENDDPRIGPLQLPSRSPLERFAPGTMTIELAAYLRDALSKQHVFDDDDLAGMIPASYKITLRYGLFGGYFGCGPRRLPWGDEKSKPDPAAPPEPPRPPGTHFLLNVMVVVERMD